MADTADLKSASARSEGSTPSPGTKTCRKCKLNKPISFFGRKTGGSGITSDCKSCRKAYPSKVSGARRLRQLKITKEDLDILVEEQHGLCLICQNPIKDFVLDHDHKSLEFRGLLCGTCNTGLGMFRDSIGILERAIRYLNSELITPSAHRIPAGSWKLSYKQRKARFDSEDGHQ